MTFLRRVIGVLLLPFILLATLATTGCASGGFKYTRMFAEFINKQNIVIRVILYIVLSLGFVVTILLDAVIFNTIDFWEGRVSDGSYQFKDGGKLYAVRHFYSDENRTLRNTRIDVYDEQGETKALSKTILLTESRLNHIQVFENGRLVAEADDIKNLPEITQYDGLGNKTQSFKVYNHPPIAIR